jgi:sugar/nucleoside kinase (ribokinase family)
VKRVLVVGELNVDLIVSGLPSLPELGQEIVCSGLARALGSSSAIFARALAGLGAQVGFMGKVGDDENGRFMVGQLQELGIDASGVLMDPGTQTGITISLTYPGEKAQITYPGSIAAYRSGEVNVEAFRNYEHLHMASMFLQTALRPGVPRLLRRAKALGLSTSLDPGWDPAGQWGEDLFEALGAVDILFLNEHEAKAIAGTGSAPAGQALRRIAPRLGPGAVALCKLGAGGALMAAGNERIQVEAHRVPVVDTTGAGDSFDAGFVFRHVVQGRPAAEALEFANACGAVAVTRVGGASSVPRAADVEEFLTGRRHLRPHEPRV